MAPNKNHSQELEQPLSKSKAKLSTISTTVPPSKQQSQAAQVLEELSYYEPQYKKGYKRPYFLSQTKSQRLQFAPKEVFYLSILIILSICIRLYRLDIPNNIILHEHHFLKSTNNYLRNQFFIDLYPPLAKFFFAAVSYFFSYDGKFYPQQMNQTYTGSQFPYVILRFITALQGIALVVFVYVILKITGCRSMVSFCGSLVFLFDSATITISRIIMPDAYFIAALGFITLVYLRLTQLQLFSKQWFKVYYLLSLALGAIISIKYSGVCTILWILCLQLKKAWLIAGDLSLSSPTAKGNGRPVGKFLAVTAIFVVCIPGLIFFAVNVVNLRLLSKINSIYDDQGYSLMSSTFQANLLGNDLGVSRKNPNTSCIPLNLLYGSKVTIRHYDSLGGYLHSHNKTYPGGSKEQQVTLYNFKDKNNEWIVEYKAKKPEEELFSKRKYVAEGAYIRLRHAVTGKYLHVNNLRGPVSEQEYDYEVSAKGDSDYLGERSDNWQIFSVLSYTYDRIDNDPGDSIIHPVGTVFRLYNRDIKCQLLSHDITLPSWGSNQQEVVCVKEASKIRSAFYIEMNSHPLLDENPNQPKVQFIKLSMWGKFMEYMVSTLMFYRNYKIYSGAHPDEQFADQWLLLDNAVGVYESKSGRVRVTFATTQIIQYVGVGLIAGFCILHILRILRDLKWYGRLFFTDFDLNATTDSTSTTGEEEKEEEDAQPAAISAGPLLSPAKARRRLAYLKYNSATADFVLGWAAHYLPVLLFVDRPLLGHNYLPAYFFLILMVGQTFELLVSRNSLAGYTVALVVCGSVVLELVQRQDTVYGL